MSLFSQYYLRTKPLSRNVCFHNYTFFFTFSGTLNGQLLLSSALDYLAAVVGGQEK